MRGHDLGPSVPGGGEYEWTYTVAAVMLPQLVEALGGAPGQAVMEVLADRWTGEAAGGVGTVIRESGIEFGFGSWSG